MSPTITEPHAIALQAFADAVAAEAARLYPGAPPVAVTFETPRRPEFGDFATNVAFSLAKHARRSPQDVATALIAGVRERESYSAIEPVAGFINLRFAAEVWGRELRRMLQSPPGFAPKGARISLEFGSANPTGPLVVVQGRTLSLGDSLAKTMRFYGYDVFTEWIINDAGAQMDTLGRSLYARYRQIVDPSYPLPEDGYPGEYLIPIAGALAAEEGRAWDVAPETQWLPYFSKYGRDRIVAQQRLTAKRFGVHYDLWQSEKALHDSGEINAGLERLDQLGHTYESEGARWFRATAFGDDKDRVLVRSDGRPTYFTNDVTFHYEKLKRADRVIDILGPDHHGYVGRLKALATSLGYSPDSIDVLISGQITLMRGEEAVSMSKRAGQIVTLDDILDEVGNDAARFFFTMLSPESPLTFDLKLAVEKTNENPVYYVQYGHARIASVLRNANPTDVWSDRVPPPGVVLDHPAELALVRRLVEFPRVVEGVVEHLAPQRLARYARDVASDFHAFYTECRILVDDDTQRRSRLALCLATRDMLARTLGLLGVSAPDSM